MLVLYSRRVEEHVAQPVEFLVLNMLHLRVTYGLVHRVQCLLAQPCLDGVIEYLLESVQLELFLLSFLCLRHSLREVLLGAFLHFNEFLLDFAPEGVQLEELEVGLVKVLADFDHVFYFLIGHPLEHGKTLELLHGLKVLLHFRYLIFAVIFF